MKLFGKLQSRQRLLANAAAANAILFLIFALCGVFDSTQITGVNAWIKPMKFASSIAIYLGTMAWIWPVLMAVERAKMRAAWMLAGTMGVEIALIALQASRGVRSHFNTATPFDGVVFQLMGIAILANTVTMCVLVRWSFRAPPSPFAWGVRLGLLLFVVFAAQGGLMIRQLAHAVGVPDGGPGLPFLNWSTTGGDLRIAHFIGIHALQGLPLIGHFAQSKPAVFAAFGAWTALAVWALARALAGMPLPIS